MASPIALRMKPTDDVDAADAEPADSASSEHSATSPASVKARKGKTRRYPSVYDAVAGRFTSTKREVRISSNFRDAILTPEEVLFQSTGAPERYEHNDIYFAHEDLPGAGEGILPDSDLLEEVHAYTSRFYEALAMQARQAQQGIKRELTEQDEEEEGPGGLVLAKIVDERSMDETALLAFGILLEEASRQVLGARGDLVFTEEEEEEMKGAEEEGRKDQADQKGQEPEGGGGDQGTKAAVKAQGSSGKRRKRRKLSAKWVLESDSD